MQCRPGKWIPLSVAAVLAVMFAVPAAFAQSTPVPVVVSILPQKYFVEKVGGNLVEVEVMVPPGGTPEQYEPKPKQMAALGKARIYFACGVPFETVWLSRIASAHPKMQVVHTDKLIGKRTMEAHEHWAEAGKTEGHAHHEAEEVKDPHVWLAPTLVMLQAREIFTALAEADPGNRETYERNYGSFVAALTDLDLSISRLFSSRRPGGAFLVFHPAWGYFADAYGLEQVPVEVEGKEPKAKDLDRLIKRARELGAKTIFIQPQFSPKSAQTIADAIGGTLVNADPLAPDWEKNLRGIAEQIGAALPGR